MTNDRDRPPNVVLILSDDLGYEVPAHNGGQSYRTPVLDELARTGMRFEQAHVMPLCTPTRVQLMTGKYNFRNYIGFGLMRPDEITFGHLFSRAGYRTCIAGKWQLYSYNPPDEVPEMRGRGQRIEDAGFDEYCIWHAHHTEQKGSRYKDPIIYQNGQYLENTAGMYGEDVFADYILDFIDRNHTEPFFVYFPMALTHRPFEPTPDSDEFVFFEPPSNQTLGGRTWATLEGWPDDVKFYTDMVEYHDKMVGRVIEKLDELALRSDTLVLYLGDNGTPREVVSKFRGEDFAGGKGLTTDAGTHVPLICDWPGTIPAGQVQTDLVDASDILPTMLDVAGITTPDEFVVDGRTFLPQLTGQRGDPREWVYFYFDPKSPRVKARPLQFVRDHRWKLYDDGRLYDLEADPHELNPLHAPSDTPEQAATRTRLGHAFTQMTGVTSNQ